MQRPRQLDAQDPDEERPGRPLGWGGRILANRQLWKNAIYSVGLLTYLCSFLFFGLAVAAVRESYDLRTAIMDMLVALYFLLQVIFLFILSTIVERRRQNLTISFPDRRRSRADRAR